MTCRICLADDGEPAWSADRVCCTRCVEFVDRQPFIFPENSELFPEVVQWYHLRAVWYLEKVLEKEFVIGEIPEGYPQGREAKGKVLERLQSFFGGQEKPTGDTALQQREFIRGLCALSGIQYEGEVSDAVEEYLS